MIDKKEINKLLRRLGGNGSYLGFYYTIYALQMAVENEELLVYVSKGLYVDVAKKFHTSVSCVERDIRTVVTLIWNHGDREYLQSIAGHPLKKKPKNGEFLDILASFLKATL